jgi:hypothetical protein
MILKIAWFISLLMAILGLWSDVWEFYWFLFLILSVFLIKNFKKSRY